MTITSRVKDELFETNEFRPIRIAPSVVPPQSLDDDLPAIRSRGTPWSAEEHTKFLDALAEYPYGPWRVIAEHIGTRTARQAMSHAQKYRQKIKRRQRDVIKQKAAKRKEQEQKSKDSTTATAAATIEEQPRATAVVATINNSSVRAPASSRYELPLFQMPAFRELEVPSMQLYVDVSELPFGSLYPERSLYDYAQYAHTYAPMATSAINIPTESYDPQTSYSHLPSLYAASTDANAATGHGSEHAGYFV